MQGPAAERPGPLSPPRRLFYLAVVLGVLGLALFMARGPLLRWFTAASGEHLTVEEARQHGVPLNLPDEASDVRFYQHLRPDQVVIVDFAISEDAFLRWAEQQGWPVEKITGSVAIWPRAMFGDLNTEVEVQEGHIYRTPSARADADPTSIVYDRETGRAYYKYQSVPFGSACYGAPPGGD